MDAAAPHQPTSELTDRQREILAFIEWYLGEHGYPPSRANICEHFDFSSPNAAEEHLRAIERKGFIHIEAGVSRGIRVEKPSGLV